MMNQKRVLIVEDAKPLAHALELKLQHQGFDVTAVHNGQEALKQLEAASFDIMLLDLVMPIMDGFQVLETLHQKGTMPIVFVLSNLAQPEDETRALGLGARKFLVKSDTPLLEIVEEIKNA